MWPIFQRLLNIVSLNPPPVTVPDRSIPEPCETSGPEDRRNEFVRRILENQYPFNVENRDNWHAEIGNAMS